jgi:hypothetical protein
MILCFDWQIARRQIQNRGLRNGFRPGSSQAEGRGFESHRPLQGQHSGEKAPIEGVVIPRHIAPTTSSPQQP